MSLEARTLALAGAMQFSYWAIRLARHGEHPEARLALAVDSLLCTDPAMPEDVFGGRAQLQTGLRALGAQLGGSREQLDMQDVGAASRVAGQLLRHAGSLLELPHTLGKISEGLQPLKQARLTQAFDSEWPISLARLYVDYISPMKPRVMVSGNPIYLRNEQLTAAIRTLLFAALRAGILWRQVGGRFWQLFLGGRQTLVESQRLLAAVPTGTASL